MNLLNYEFKKLFHKKVSFFLLLLLFALNIFLFRQDQKDVVFHNTPEYQALLDKYSAIDPEQAYNELKENRTDYGIIGQILQARSQGFSEDIIKNNVQSGMYSEAIQYETFLEQNSDLIEHESKFNSISAATNELIEELNAVLSYPQFIDSMAEKAQSMESISIFAKKDTFAYRNIPKTVLDFSDLKLLPLSLGQEDGILAVSKFTFTDYFLLALLLFLAIFIFVDERESGLLPILKSTKHGRLKLAYSKLCVLLFSTVCLAILFYGSNFLIAKERFGFGDTSRYIQSMASFRDVELPLTVSHYLLLMFLLKLLTLLLFAVIVSLLFTIVTNTKLVFVMIGGILTFSYLAYTFIYPTSYLNPLKYLNLFSFLDSYRMIAYYNNLNLLGQPVSRLSSSIYVIFIILTLCLFAYLWIFSMTGSKTSSLYFNLWKTKGFKHLSKGSVHLFHHELYKILFSNKGLLLLLFAFLLGFTNLDQSELLYTSKQYYYEAYAQQLAGNLNDSKASFLQNEQERFNQIPEEIQTLTEQYNNNEISQAEYKAQSITISDFSQFQEGFQEAKQQYESLSDLQVEKGIPVHFISTIPCDYMFDNSNRDLQLVLFYSVFLILCLCNLFCSEYRNGMLKLIRSTKNGRGKLFFKKSFLAYAIAVLLMLFLYLPVYITLAGRYHFTEWSAPIQSILTFQNFPLELSVLQFIVLVWMIQLITAFAMVSILLLLAQLLKKQTLTILTGVLTLSVPMIFRYLIPDLFERFSFADGFNMYWHISQQDSFRYVCFYVVAMILITILAEIVAYRKFCYQNLS